MFTATQEASVERQRDLMSKIKDSSVDLDTFRSQSKTILANSLEGMKEDQKKIATAAMAGVLAGGSELSKSVEAITKLLNATYKKSETEINEILSKPRITASQTSEATIGMDQQRAIIQSSNEVLKKMQPMLDLALKAGTEISGVLNGVAGAISTKLPAIIEYVDKTAKQIGPAVETVIGATMSSDELVKKLGGWLDKAGSIIADGTQALFGDKDAQKRFFTDLRSGWDGVMKYIKESVPSLSSFFGGSSKKPGEAASSKPEKPLVDQIVDGIVKQGEALGDRIGNSFWGDPTKAKTSSVPANPKGKAEGGETTPGSYLVGEEGPELVNLGTRGDVINNDNLTAMVASMTNQNGMKESIDQLNNTNSQMLSAIRDLIDISKRTLTATKGLNGNLFAA